MQLNYINVAYLLKLRGKNENKNSCPTYLPTRYLRLLTLHPVPTFALFIANWQSSMWERSLDKIGSTLQKKTTKD